MLKKYGKYPILKISKISYIFELEIMGYISDIYRRYISPIYIVPTLRVGRNLGIYIQNSLCYFKIITVCVITVMMCEFALHRCHRYHERVYI